MELVKLRFPNLRHLWLFRLEHKIHAFDINPREQTLSCPCSDELIRKAKTDYSAEIVLDDSTELTW